MLVCMLHSSPVSVLTFKIHALWSGVEDFRRTMGGLFILVVCEEHNAFIFRDFVGAFVYCVHIFRPITVTISFSDATKRISPPKVSFCMLHRIPSSPSVDMICSSRIAAH
jgi:hypothetical protein